MHTSSGKRWCGATSTRAGSDVRNGEFGAGDFFEVVCSGFFSVKSVIEGGIEFRFILGKEFAGDFEGEFAVEFLDFLFPFDD